MGGLKELAALGIGTGMDDRRGIACRWRLLAFFRFCINIRCFATYHRNAYAKIAHYFEDFEDEVVLVILVAMRRAMAFVPFAFEHLELIEDWPQPKEQTMDCLGSTT